MNETLQVRLATLEDISAIVVVEATSFPVGAIGPLDAQTILDRMTAHKRHLILVAELGQSVIGHALAYPEKGKLYLWSAAVQPNHRRQGVMTAILRRLFQIAYEQGFQHVFSRTSNRNVQMLRLALSMGFEIVGYKSREWQDEQGYWESAVYLETSTKDQSLG